MINVNFLPSRRIALYMARLFLSRSLAVLVMLVMVSLPGLLVVLVVVVVAPQAAHSAAAARINDGCRRRIAGSA